MDSINDFYVIIGSDIQKNKSQDKILGLTTEEYMKEDLQECLEENDVMYDVAEEQVNDLLHREDRVLSDVYSNIDYDGTYVSKIPNFSIRVEKMKPEYSEAKNMKIGEYHKYFE